MERKYLDDNKIVEDLKKIHGIKKYIITAIVIILLFIIGIILNFLYLNTNSDLFITSKILMIGSPFVLILLLIIYVFNGSMMIQKNIRNNTWNIADTVVQTYYEHRDGETGNINRSYQFYGIKFPCSYNGKLFQNEPVYVIYCDTKFGTYAINVYKYNEYNYVGKKFLNVL